MQISSVVTNNSRMGPVKKKNFCTLFDTKNILARTGVFVAFISEMMLYNRYTTFEFRCESMYFHF